MLLLFGPLARRLFSVDVYGGCDKTGVFVGERGLQGGAELIQGGTQAGRSSRPDLSWTYISLLFFPSPIFIRHWIPVLKHVNLFDLSFCRNSAAELEWIMETKKEIWLTWRSTWPSTSLTHTHAHTPTYVATVMTNVRSLILETPDWVGLDDCVRLGN